MKRLPVLFLGALLLSAAACIEAPPTGLADDAAALPSFSVSTAFPDVIPLPVRPEGIAVGNGSTFYFGDIAGLGIWRGDLRTGEVTQISPDTRPVMGMKYDARSGYLFAARGPSGWATVIDGETGATIANFQFFLAPPGFVNDVIVTRSAAWFTNSFRPVLYRVPLKANGQLAGGFDIVPLTGEYQQAAPFGTAPVTCAGIPGPLSANGIEATPDGDWLIVNTLARGELYRVDPATGDARLIDLGGGNVCLADGNLLAGRTLYVMQNLAGRMAVVSLSKDYLSGTIERYITGTDPMTTMARFGSSIYAVTAGFPFLPPSQPHQVVRFGM